VVGGCGCSCGGGLVAGRGGEEAVLAGGFLADWLWGGFTTTKETHDDDL